MAHLMEVKQPTLNNLRGDLQWQKKQEMAGSDETKDWQKASMFA